MAETKRSWTFLVGDSPMSAVSARAAIRPPYSYRLNGVDGSLAGVLRPFPGFREIHRFSPALWLPEGGNHNASSTIVDIQYITFVIGETGYGYGFVYRVRRKNQAVGSSACDVFVDFWNSKTGKWTLAQSLKTGVPLSREFDSANGKHMSVAVWGRFVFVYLEDSEPVSFWVKEDLAGPSYDFTLITNTGPGLVPNLRSPVNVTSLGGILTLDTPDRPGNGQVDVIEFTPADSEVSALVDSGHAQFGEAATIRPLKPGDYTFAYHRSDSRTGRRSALSKVAQVTRDLFDPDGSGPDDPLDLYAVMEITYDSAKYDQAFVYRSVRVQGAGGTYVGAILHLDRIITLSEYLTLNNPLSPTTVKQALYWFDLEDKPLAFQTTYNENVQFDEDLPKGGAALLYEGVMLVSSIGSPSVSSSESNRVTDATRGTGELRWSSLVDGSPELFPPSNVYYPNLTSNEIIVMKTVGPNVIGFSKDRQYHIRKEGGYIKVTEMHEGYGVVNPNACDTAGSYVYFVSSNGLKAVDSNGRLDDVQSINELVLERWRRDERGISVAFDPTLACVFIFNNLRSEAALLWLNTSKVTMLQDLPFQKVGRCAWPDSFVYDKGNLLDPTKLGVDNTTYGNDLVERAFFVQNPPRNTSSDAITNFEFRVFIVDYLRERVKTAGSKSGQADRCLLPNAADSYFALSGAFSSGSTLNLTTTGKYLSGELWGARVYVMKSANPALLNKSAVIRSTTSAGNTISLTTASAPNLYGLATGDVIGISPIYFEWQGHPLPYVIDMAGGDQQQLVMDYFKVRHISSIACSFSDVTGDAQLEDRTVARFRGLAFLGSKPDPEAIADTRDNSAALVQSVSDHESTYYAPFGRPTGASSEGYYGIRGTYITPGVRILIPDIDFKLLAVRVEGSVMEQTTTARRS